MVMMTLAVPVDAAMVVMTIVVVVLGAVVSVTATEAAGDAARSCA